MQVLAGMVSWRASRERGAAAVLAWMRSAMAEMVEFGLGLQAWLECAGLAAKRVTASNVQRTAIEG